MTRDTIRPHGVPDRFTRTERDDHAANSVLHDTLKAGFGPGNDGPTVNLMGSHAPGEKTQEPTYEVWVETRNEGLGHPAIPEVVRRMVDRDDATITGVVECSDDHLTVSVRPVVTRVDPIEVDERDLPDRYVDLSEIEHDAAVTLRQVVDEYGVDHARTNEAARCLATVVYTANPGRYTDFVEDPEAAPRAAYRQLWRRAGVDPDTNEVTNISPTGDGRYQFSAPVDERVAPVDTPDEADDQSPTGDTERDHGPCGADSGVDE